MRLDATDNADRPLRLFVLGTGRCGTKTLAHILDALPGCAVRHEVQPMLLAEVDDYLAGRMSRADLADILRRTRCVERIGGERLCGESNQRLSFILPVVNEVFPGAFYLWIIRDGRSGVASMVHRYWYHRREAALREWYHGPSAETRIRGDVVGDVSAETWQAFDPFERCCWYWSFTNRHIPAQASQLGLNLLCVRLEDLGDSLRRIMDWLGLSDLPTPALRRANPARHGRPLPWHRWTSRQFERFAELAGPVMDEHYPGWRDERPQGDNFSAMLDRGRYQVSRFAGHVTRRLRECLRGQE